MQHADTPTIRDQFIERFAKSIPAEQIDRHRGDIESLVYMVQCHVDDISAAFGARIDTHGIFSDMDRWLADRGYVHPDHS